MNKLLFLFFVCSLSPVLADVSLPAIGHDSNYQLQREKEIGEQFHQKLLSANKIINDPLVNFYLSEVAFILLQNLDENYRSYTISIIDGPSVNAFAIPGGYIGINYGLILASQTEAQLAGVLAHEISHITLNHLSQLLQKQQSTNSALIASMLLALVLSQSLDSDQGRGDAVGALVVGGIAGAQQAMINFTRENEYEADRKGLELMVKAGYPAVGMAEFFSILEGVSGGGLASIEYLRTHPISSNRMGEAYQFRAKQSLKPKEDSIEYELFKVYLNFLVAKGYKTLKENATVVQFEKALGSIRLNEQAVAEQILEKLHAQKSDNVWLNYALIDLYIAQSKYHKALKIIDKELLIYPQQTLFILKKIKVLILAQRYIEAQILAENELDKNVKNQQLRHTLVSIYTKLGKENKARETEGDFMLNQGNLIRAKYLYKRVLDDVTDTRVRQSVEEKIKAIDKLRPQHNSGDE